MSDHARFSFSSAHRWLECPGSVRSSENVPNTSSWQADLGTRLHAVAADLLMGKPEEFNKLIGEEAEIVNDYVEYVQGLAKAPASKLLVEQRVTLTPDVWGTCDAIVIQPYVLHVVDFKTGSQRVDATNNAQLLGYAAAALKEFNVLPSPISHEVRPVDVHMHIVQTSIGWIDSWKIPVQEIDAYVRRVNAAVKSACSASPLYKPSEESCKYCPAKNNCRARAEFNVKLAVEDFALADATELSPEEIAEILPQVPQIVAWATSIQEYATSIALKGQSVPGYKLVQSGGARKWADPVKAINALIAAGIPPLTASKATPIGIGDAEKLLGKKHPVFVEQTVRGDVKPTLARESDKRAPWNGSEDFPSDK